MRSRQVLEREGAQVVERNAQRRLMTGARVQSHPHGQRH